MSRSARGELVWCVTAYPCEAFAQDADMSLTDYEDFVYRSGWLHLDDPVAAWKDFSAKLHTVKDRLEDVRDAAGGRRGHRHHRGRRRAALDPRRRRPQLPRRRGVHRAGESSHQRRGALLATRRSSAAARWTTCGCGSRAAGWSRARRQPARACSAQMLAVDDGASVLGEFAIGTNYDVDRFTKQILFDEKIGGTFHMAVGAGYPETGSANVSALHWDMVCDLRDGGEIYADGELIYSRRQVPARVLARPDAAGRVARRRAGWPAGHPGDPLHERQVVQAQHAARRRARRPRPRRPCPRGSTRAAPAARPSPPCASRPAAAGSRAPSSSGRAPQRGQVGGGGLAEPEAGVEQRSRRGGRRPPRRPRPARAGTRRSPRARSRSGRPAAAWAPGRGG